MTKAINRSANRSAGAFRSWTGRVAAATLGLSLMMGAMIGPATAQSANAPRAEVVKLLGERYAETPSALGLASNGGVIEVFAAKDGSTWTIVLTTPDGLSRIVATGEAWTAITRVLGQAS